ncbi:DUF378 domain-containing protein [Brassicibacter mesophilus]|jgi:uncharacterized protein|uniref:DUF378 domain-containing protein n=1 Tax=Brassicibacter mesophilus TaxID=745119 RepID=UPI003D1EE6CD
MKVLTSIASILMIIGALNWGLVGLFNFDFVQKLFGSKDSLGARIVYTLIGLAGLYTILYLIF